ncbi:MAG: hypothetical protein IJX06_01205 [Clostridia bacterium]|nr:hypothetical protein [Clostridia bacterium]
MAKTKKQKINQELPKTKWFLAITVLGILGLVLGIFLLPVWKNTSVFWKNWGTDGVSVILCAIIVAYTICYLGSHLGKVENKTLRIISIIEIVLLSLMAIGCLLQQFKVFDFFGPSSVLGAILWHRGFFNVIKAYLCKHTKKDRYPLWLVIVSVLMVSIGTALRFRSVPGNAFIWFMSIALLVGSIVMVFGSLKMKPNKNQQEEIK